MATPVVSNGAVDTVGVAFPGVSIVAAGVLVGDVIAVGAMTFPTNSGSVYPWTCGNGMAVNQDNLGNVYTERVYQAGPGAFKEIHVWTCKVTVSGSPTIIVKRTSPGNSAVANVGLVVYRDAGDFDQATPYLANFTPSDISYATGCGTGTFTYADTLIVTFENNPGGNGAPPSDDHSLTGDTRIGDVDSGPAGRLVIWARIETGPGNGRVEIETVPSGDNILCTVTFSKPLARPGGTIVQHQVRAGAGFQNQVAPFNDNRPLDISFAYPVEIGSFVAIVVGQQSAALTDLIISDTYGNVYTLEETDTTHGKLVAFTTTIVGIPATGTVFKLQLSGTPAVLTTIYQSTEIGIVEIIPPTGYTLGTVSFAVFASMTGSPPTVTSTTANLTSVPTGTYLVAWSIVAGVSNGTLTWVPKNSFTLQQYWDFIQYLGEDVNRYRLGAMAMSDYTVPSMANYAAKTEVTVDSADTITENIMLMGIEFDAISPEDSDSITFSDSGSATVIPGPGPNPPPQPGAAPTQCIPSGVFDSGISPPQVGPSLFVSCPPSGNLDTAYDEAIPTTGGTPAYTYVISDGSLPTGLTLGANGGPDAGKIQGTPDNATDFPFQVTVTDAVGTVYIKDCTLSIGPPLPPPIPGVLTIACPVGGGTGTTGIVYDKFMVTTGGTSPFGFSIIAGSLPNGILLFYTTGRLIGTPTVPGTFNFTVQVVDITAAVNTCDCTIVIS